VSNGSSADAETLTATVGQQQPITTPAEHEATGGAESTPSPPVQRAPAAVQAPAALRTAEDVIAFGEGFGAEALHGTIESTALFEIIRDNL
jgi:hypothetical protein